MSKVYDTFSDPTRSSIGHVLAVKCLELGLGGRRLFGPEPFGLGHKPFSQKVLYILYNNTYFGGSHPVLPMGVKWARATVWPT